jgi:hypothetical protein
MASNAISVWSAIANLSTARQTRNRQSAPTVRNAANPCMSTCSIRALFDFVAQHTRGAMGMPKLPRRRKPMEFYVHHVPGRLRVRIPAVRKNPRKADEIKDLLDICGVDKLKVNPLTGSVVVNFDPSQVTPQQLLQILKGEGLFDSSRAITCDEKIQRASNHAASKVGRAMFGYAVGKILEASGFPILAALI